MLAAHMDEIGLIVSYIDENGFARFHAVGGVRPTTLVGSRVRFEDGVTGVIGVEKIPSQQLPTLEKLYLDLGATSRENCPLQVGAVGVFERPFVSQQGRWLAKAMDDRIGCAVLIELLRRMQPPAYDVYAVFTTQEELGLRGATASAFGVDPQLALAVDVAPTGDTPEGPKLPISLGKGVAIAVKDGGMITHPGLRRHLIQICEAANIPYQLEVMDRGSTDAAVMQVTRAGVPAAVLSVPCRYVHTPSEMVDTGDVTATLDLLLRLVSEPVGLG